MACAREEATRPERAKVAGERDTATPSTRADLFLVRAFVKKNRLSLFLTGIVLLSMRSAASTIVIRSLFSSFSTVLLQLSSS